MSDVKLVGWRRLQFMLAFFYVSEDQLPQLLLGLILFLRLMQLDCTWCWFLLLCLGNLLVCLTINSSSRFWLAFDLPLLFNDALTVVRTIRIILISKKVELRIVGFNLHDE